jgi:nucleoside phosphorylase
MDGLEGSMVMAQAALGVKNAAIGECISINSFTATCIINANS